jgi:hypothetical protein
MGDLLTSRRGDLLLLVTAYIVGEVVNVSGAVHSAARYCTL